jgi:hypothetical protein
MGASNGQTLALFLCAVMLSACSEEWSEDCQLPPLATFAAQHRFFAAGPNVLFTGSPGMFFTLLESNVLFALLTAARENANGLLSEVA